MTPSDMNATLEKATVPEHSLAFMAAMSGGEPFLVGPYAFIAAEDWLLAVGYPLDNTYTPRRSKRLWPKPCAARPRVTVGPSARSSRSA